MQDSARKFKEEVAEAAISLFKRNGYNNVTVNEICKECGILEITRSSFKTSLSNSTETCFAFSNAVFKKPMMTLFS